VLILTLLNAFALADACDVTVGYQILGEMLKVIFLDKRFPAFIENATS
jgi:hypothetical protein